MALYYGGTNQSLFLGDNTEVPGGEQHDVCNLLSNGSERSQICVCRATDTFEETQSKNGKMFTIGTFR